MTDIPITVPRAFLHYYQYWGFFGFQGNWGLLWAFLYFSGNNNGGDLVVNKVVEKAKNG